MSCHKLFIGWWGWDSTIFWPNPVIRHGCDSRNCWWPLDVEQHWMAISEDGGCWHTLENSVLSEIAQLYFEVFECREVHCWSPAVFSGVGEIRWFIGSSASVLRLIQAKRTLPSLFGWENPPAEIVAGEYARRPWTTSGVFSALNFIHGQWSIPLSTNPTVHYRSL